MDRDNPKYDGLSPETVTDNPEVKHPTDETLAETVPEATANPGLHGSARSALSGKAEGSDPSHSHMKDCSSTSRHVPHVHYIRESRALKSRRSTSVGVIPTRQVKPSRQNREPSGSVTRGNLLTKKGRVQSHLQVASLPNQVPDEAGECSGILSEASKGLRQSSCGRYSNRELNWFSEKDSFPGESSLLRGERSGTLCPRGTSEEAAEAQNRECSYRFSRDFAWYSDKQNFTAERSKQSSSPPCGKSNPSVSGKNGEGCSAEGSAKSCSGGSRGRSSKACRTNLKISEYMNQKVPQADLPRDLPQVEDVQDELSGVTTETSSPATNMRPLAVEFDATEILRGTSLNLPHLSVMLAVPLVSIGLVFFSDALAMNDWFKATYQGRVETVGLWLYCVNNTCTTFAQERTHFTWPLWQSRLAMCLAILVAVPALCVSVKNLHDYWFRWRRLQYVDDAMQFMLVALLFLFFATLFVTFTEIKRFGAYQALVVEPGLAYIIAFVGLFSIMVATVLLQWSYVCCKLDRRSRRLIPLQW